MSTRNFEVMRKAYLLWGKLLLEAFQRGLEASQQRQSRVDIGSVIVCGMGGSGIVGDYAASLAYSKGSIPVYTVKSYTLPSWAAESLVVAVSFSGNTVETLNCYMRARQLARAVAVVASGGKLLKLAREHGITYVQTHHAPAARTAFASLLGGLLGLLEGLGVLEARGEVGYASALLSSEAGNAEAEAEKLAELVENRIPVFIACGAYEPLAWRAKNEFNENTKVQSWAEALPEWGHNGAEAWSRPIEPSRYIIIGFLDEEDKVCSSLVKHALETVRASGASTHMVKLLGQSLLAKMMWGTLVTGLASIVAARRRGVDPLETPKIKAYRAAVESLLAGEST